MEFVFGIAVANWKDEQLEVSKWFKKMDRNEMYKQSEGILVKIFLKFVREHLNETNSRNIRNATICMGTSPSSINSSKVSARITKKIHYTFAKGRYMDPKKRSYFVPKEIILEGDVDIDEL